MIEVWLTAKLNPEQFDILAELAGRRFPAAIAEGWPASTQVPNLLRDMFASMLEPLIGPTQWSGGRALYDE